MSFFGSIGGIFKGAIPSIVHAIPGVSQAYDAIQAVGGIVKGNSAVGKIISRPIAPLPAPAAISNDPTIARIPIPALVPSQPMSGPPNLPVLAGPPGGGTVKIIPSQRGAVPAGQPGGFGITPGARTRGHYTKKGYWSSRRRPRMNPMNVRAARRAVNRIHAAEKLFRRILSVAHPGKPHGHIAPKRGKR